MWGPYVLDWVGSLWARPFASRLGFPTKNPSKLTHMGPIFCQCGAHMCQTGWVLCGHAHLHPIWAFLPKTHQNQHTWAPYFANVGPICVRLGGFCVARPFASHLGRFIKNCRCQNLSLSDKIGFQRQISLQRQKNPFHNQNCRWNMS